MIDDTNIRGKSFHFDCRFDQGMVRAKLFLNHETIAQHIGSSRETVSRMLSDFKRRGIAELVGTTLLVHDPADLECLSIS